MRARDHAGWTWTVSTRSGVRPRCAKGRDAEGGQDVGAATAAYQVALTFDADNPAARDGLTRLDKPVPELRAPEPVPQPAPAGPAVAPPGLLMGLGVATVALLLGLFGLVSWAEWWRRQAAEESRQAAKDDSELATAQREQDRNSAADAHQALDEIRKLILELRSELRSSTELCETGFRESTQRDTTVLGM